jgi:hypothetical protein
MKLALSDSAPKLSCNWPPHELNDTPVVSSADDWSRCSTVNRPAVEATADATVVGICASETGTRTLAVARPQALFTVVADSVLTRFSVPLNVACHHGIT